MANGTGGDLRFSGSRGKTESDCTRLVASFAYSVDHRRYDDLVSLFAEDGSFIRPDISAHGHVAIMQSMRERPEGIVTRHVCGPTHFTSVDDKAASSVTYVTIYRVPGVDGETAKTKGAAGIAEFSDEFILTPGGWKIQRRTAKPVFILEV